MVQDPGDHLMSNILQDTEEITITITSTDCQSFLCSPPGDYKKCEVRCRAGQGSTLVTAGEETFVIH